MVSVILQIALYTIFVGALFPEGTSLKNYYYEFYVTNSYIRKSLSLHAVSFGNEDYSGTLRSMANIASNVQSAAPADQQGPPCGYASALDTVHIPVLLNSSKTLTP